jgi:hypothetical protein
VNNKESEILNYALQIIKDKRDFFLGENFEYAHSERCIEVPWVALKLTQHKVRSLLDVGFTMASLDYMGLLLHLKKGGMTLEGVDIVKPERVKSRYPEEWLEDILSIPVTIMDITKLKFSDKKFDAVSIISTIEHVGFDKATHNNINTAFDRRLNPEEVEFHRDGKIEESILNNLHEVLNDNGIIFISVPIGDGGPVLLRDSLGYYTAQWEYEEESWKKITVNSKYKLLEEFFYILDGELWKQVDSIRDARGKSSELLPFSQALAVCALRKVG